VANRRRPVSAGLMKIILGPDGGEDTLPGSNRPHTKTLKGCTLLAGFAAAVVLLSGCAKAPKVYHVGILIGAETMSALSTSFKDGMTGLGYVEGGNITYDIRSSNGDPAEEKRIAGEFSADNADLVFSFFGQTARNVKLALQGTGIPIVFANAVIEGTDLVDSVRAPGGNITGVRVAGTELTLKCFESLLELAPRVKRVMIIYDPMYPTVAPALAVLRPAASSADVTLQEVHVTQVQDIQAIIGGLEKSGGARMDAIMFLQDTIPRSVEASGLIFKFADAHRVPVVGGPAALVENGGVVLSAASDIPDQGKKAASLANKIFKGAPAGTLPVLTTQPTLFINYGKAQELGLTVPEGLLKQASKIIRYQSPDR
jgi:putative ABC transport system substrate-binding protein